MPPNWQRLINSSRVSHRCVAARTEIWGKSRFVKRAFDSQGRETFVSWPSASSAPTTGTWTEYDALGRTTAVSQNSELGLLTATTEYLANLSQTNLMVFHL